MLSIKEQRDLFAPVSALRRTGQRSAESVLELPATTSEHFLNLQPAELTAVAAGWGKVADRLPPSMMTAAQRLTLSRASLPAQEGWQRATVTALSAARQDFPGLALPPPEPIAELLSSDLALRAIQGYAAQAKDGALDLRAVAGAFGWYQVSAVMDWLRDHQEDPDYDKILEAFTPMLVVLSQVQVERSDDRKASLLAQERVEKEAGEAQEQARVAENQVAFAQGKPLSREELIELAEAEAPPASPPQTRRTPRGQRKR